MSAPFLQDQARQSIIQIWNENMTGGGGPREKAGGKGANMEMDTLHKHDK